MQNVVFNFYFQEASKTNLLSLRKFRQQWEKGNGSNKMHYKLETVHIWLETLCNS